MCDPYVVHMDVPVLDIGVIQGGLFRVSVVVKNSGLAEADDVDWVISLDGGSIFLGRESSGVVGSIAAGGQEVISSSLIFGLGEVDVLVSASGPECSDFRSQGGAVFFIWVRVNPGGG